MYEDPIPGLKRQLADELVRVMHGWKQTDVALKMHIDPPRVADLRNGRLDRFSVQAIVRFLKRMGHCVTVTVMSDRATHLRARAARRKS
jgi:predicted XRE-type DNA-binding protein